MSDLQAFLPVVIAAIVGILAGAVTDGLKQIPYLSNPEREQLAGVIMPFVAGLVSIAFGFAATHVYAYYQGMPESAQQLIIVLCPWIIAEIRHRWRAAGNETTTVVELAPLDESA